MAKTLAPVPADGSAPAGAGSAVNASGAPSKNTIMRPKSHNKDVDPAMQPVGIRTYAPKERCGACYGVQVGFEAHTAPEVGSTLSNGRLFSAAINRSAPNFRMGMADFD